MSSFQKIDLDEVDLQLLRALQDDARLSTKELAKRVHKSSTATYERIKRMEAAGVIAPPAALGKELVVFVSIRLKEHRDTILEAFQSDLRGLFEVEEWYHITGPHDFMLKVAMPSMDAYHRFLNKKLAALPNISTVQSLIVLHRGK
jgi:DNA-binding Lrp family transcriptional regulator